MATPLIIAIEQAHTRGWMHLWIESDSQLAILASKSHYSLFDVITLLIQPKKSLLD
jgi:hypothetical protein